MFAGHINTKKPQILLGGIFFVIVLVLLFVLEMRYFRQLVRDYDHRVQEIVLSDMNFYFDDLEYFTKSVVKNISDLNSEDNKKLFDQVNDQDSRIQDIYLINEQGDLIYSLNSALLPFAYYSPGSPDKDEIYFYSNQDISKTSRLYISAPINDTFNHKGYLIMGFNISDLQKELIIKYANENLKVAVFDDNYNPLSWPFTQDKLLSFDSESRSFNADSTNYQVISVKIPNTVLTAYFFFKDTNYLIYRIFTIILLLFGLYILIYQFIVEVLNINAANSYFENIDFSIFNNLNEGIIIANKFDKIIFTNSAAHEIFNQKQILHNSSNLRDVIGNYSPSVRKIILKKSDNNLEIIQAPLIKQGKLLGTLVVISISMENEKFFGYAFEKVAVMLPDGFLMVDKSNKIVIANMMANYYLGTITEGMEINDVSDELSELINKNIGTTFLTRSNLSSGIICEFMAVYDREGLYNGTIIVLKR